MNRGVSRFIPMIFVIVIVVLVIAAIVSIIRVMIGDGGDQTEETNTSQTALLSTDSGRSVRMTVRGEIVAEENFRSYQVTVSPDEREFARYQGYLSKVLVEKAYANNTKAYEQFVFALDRAGMTNGKQLSDEADDTRGVCAGGTVYEFEILNVDQPINHLWTTSCSGAKGSLKADASVLQQLFLAQVPEAETYIGKD